MKHQWYIEGLAFDAWIDAIPDDPYQPCPCGCGKKWRFALKDATEDSNPHEDAFVAKWIKEKSQARTNTLDKWMDNNPH